VLLLLLLLQDEYGGFNSSRVVDDFVYYADTVFSQLGRFVRTWITFNEPLVTCDMGFKAGGATGHTFA
jgi:beta-glucosidase/6-phospho-beta-glucosidase/beta-galactosidase